MKKQFLPCAWGLMLCVAAMSAAATAAATTRSTATELGVASDWVAHKYFDQDDKGKRTPVCVLSSQAILSQPKGLLAGRTPVAYIARRRTPGAPANAKSWYYEITIKTGASLLPDRAPKLQIGEREFSLYAGATRSNREAEWAWVRVREIKTVIILMRHGSNMELTSLVEDERQVRTRFSLFGISKGLVLINKSCV